MIRILKDKRLFNEFVFLGVLSFVCFSMSIFRAIYTDSPFFLFLNWNLFLAAIPWMLSTFVKTKPIIQKSKFKMSIIALIWLLFFPNAPYILTDLFHLRVSNAMPIWFDLMLVLLFAWTGLMFGFLSFMDIEKIWQKNFKFKWNVIFPSLLLFIGSFGIYIGRYLRWNSWDIIKDPVGLILDISRHLFHPFKYPDAFGMTILMGFFLNGIYWSFKLMKIRDNKYSKF